MAGPLAPLSMARPLIFFFLVNRLDITCAQSPDMRTLFYIYLEDLPNADAINYEFSIFESILIFAKRTK